jgi:hypothetical protein
MEKKVGMLGVTEKSFGHLSGRYDVAGAPLADDRSVLRPRRSWMKGSLEYASHILQIR